MTESSTSQVTQLLRAWNEGDQSALEKLTPIVYDELRRMARQYLAYERPSHTLQSAALVNEVYLRLVDSEQAIGKIEFILLRCAPGRCGGFWWIGRRLGRPSSGAAKSGRSGWTKHWSWTRCRMWT